ncbi:hypothetical protein [Leptospira kirschneri]|uniref:SWIM-type domain-containing protein n=1 Tax=Leptospira kirschneri str. 200802841 TaxID=1193047 RepID=A0A828XVY5_9LEPT|nr:hypothetical protein [Leptospira kirschneri]EJO71170.1 hypothetical protein LEP1GSC044_3984 [Leptospira kirschneri serovar Grippotyphosa str. RM52]EKO51586.1 hypothetical protein LEP1GSC131_0273 [Leptospira kirschneri str. 200802841]EKQ85377.1 hypothetical protein LEP1GSC064_3387 [Leptospira kirschneri serovar Grippotyphosa str. Moskva]EKR07160.1 hypothetical protein LEP1GSC122_0348 [Leptospira kirschneri serovar Valbuzzi str. 200702274]OOV48749.1 hypothetical protein B1J94_10200 [Leptospir
MRQDILSLSLQELEVLTSKGTVNRALKDIESGTKGEWKETENGSIEVVWEDSVTCILPGSVPIQESSCTCSSTGVCRHIIRTIVAYQKRTISDKPNLSWNPGSISDESLRSFISASSFTKAKSIFNSGIAVELDRTDVPVAKIHGLGTVHFPVPNDIRYARADCKGSLGEQIIAVAVWSFRLTHLEKEFVSTNIQEIKISSDITDRANIILKEIVQYGFQGASEYLKERLSQLERSCLEEGLLWPAEVLSELQEEYSKYLLHDSLFDPDQVVYLLGEWIIRMDALKENKGAVPSLVIRGDTKAYSSELIVRSLIGLGSGIKVFKKGFVVLSYFADPKSDKILLYECSFEKQMDEPFHSIGNFPVLKGIPIYDFGKSSILSSSIKKNASGKLQFSNKVTLNPQTFSFESLSRNIFSDNFNETMKTLLEKPPRPLGPRWAAGNFFVFKVERFTQPHFDNILQQMNIELEDQNGNIAYAQLPYYSRASDGIENLQHALVDSHLRYVCGIADVTSGRLYIKPVSFVIEQGGNRTMLQPYLDPKSHSDKSNFQTQNQVRSETDSLKNYITELRTTISEVCLIGLKQFGKINHWKKLVQQSENLGLKRISTLLESVITSIQSSKETNVSPIFTLIALLCLSKEMELLSQK